MTQIKTLGRFPTLAEMRAYYNRDDVLSFLYDASQRRNVTAALFGKHWEIQPKSRENLREIINETIRTKIEPLCPNDANNVTSIHIPVELVEDLKRPDFSKETPANYTVLWHGTTADRVKDIVNKGFRPRGRAQAVWFSSKYGLSHRVAKHRASQRGSAPVVFRCLFSPEQTGFLQKENNVYFLN